MSNEGGATSDNVPAGQGPARVGAGHDEAMAKRMQSRRAATGAQQRAHAAAAAAPDPRTHSAWQAAPAPTEPIDLGNMESLAYHLGVRVNQPLVDMEWTRQTAAALDLVVQLLGAELSLIEGGKVPFGPFMDIHQVNSVNLPWMAERRVAIATDSTLKQECDLELELLGDTVIRVQKENWQKQSLIQELTHEGQALDRQIAAREEKLSYMAAKAAVQ